MPCYPKDDDSAKRHNHGNQVKNSREATVYFPGDLTRKELHMATAMVEEKKLSTVPLSWAEVYYTNCPLVSASNVDQELGWTKEEYKKIGVKYALPSLYAPRTTGTRTTSTTSTT